MHKFTLFHNANIITMDEDFPMAYTIVFSSVGHHEGRIVYVGRNEDLFPKYGEIAEVIDLKGKTVLPGLTDSHIHLRNYALGLDKLSLFGDSKQAVLEKISEKASQLLEGEWILGHGWNQNEWETGFGNTKELDQASPNNPVYLTATSLHVAWANTLAMKTGKISPTTPNPHNGEIGRDENGSANGILFETAMEIVSSQIPKPTLQETQNAILCAQAQLWELGITAIHDFDRMTSFSALQILHKQKKLQIRVIKNLPVESLDEIINAGLQSGLGDNLLQIGGIKVFADGALGPHTAAMLASYEGEENKGMLFLDGEEFFEIGKKATKGGLSMTVHAIGDAANHEMLNGYQQLRNYEKDNNLPTLRHRIEHAQVLHPQDFQRFNEINIIASIQPIHAIADMQMADEFWGDRSINSYAWNSLLKTGVMLAFGSDAPVASPNPFYGLHAAISRLRLDDELETAWHPNECLSLQQAIKGYTTGAAYAANQEHQLGKLKEGYLADMIILEKNLFELEPREIREIRPLGTILGGELVFGDM
jgi:predicted amidohydrolase YtcJ